MKGLIKVKKFSVLMILSILIISILGGTVYADTDHWAKPYANKIIELYPDAADFINSIQFDKAVTEEDFRVMVELMAPNEEEFQLDNVTREAVVDALVKYWSKTTGAILGDVVVPMVIVFEDEMEIDFDYRSNIMIAYFKGLVKGKGNGKFDPKENLTYGEAITLISRYIDLINEEEITEKEASKDFETRATANVEEDEVIFNFNLKNHSEESREIHFSSGQQFEIVVTNEEGEEVYRYSDDNSLQWLYNIKR